MFFNVQLYVCCSEDLKLSIVWGKSCNEYKCVCVLGTQQVRNGSTPSPPPTTEEPWASCWSTTSPTPRASRTSANGCATSTRWRRNTTRVLKRLCGLWVSVRGSNRICELWNLCSAVIDLSRLLYESFNKPDNSERWAVGKICWVNSAAESWELRARQIKSIINSSSFLGVRKHCNVTTRDQYEGVG